MKKLKDLYVSLFLMNSIIAINVLVKLKCKFLYLL